MAQEWVKIGDLAKRLNVSRQAIHQRIERGTLEGLIDTRKGPRRNSPLEVLYDNNVNKVSVDDSETQQKQGDKPLHDLVDDEVKNDGLEIILKEREGEIQRLGILLERGKESHESEVDRLEKHLTNSYREKWAFLALGFALVGLLSGIALHFHQKAIDETEKEKVEMSERHAVELAQLEASHKKESLSINQLRAIEKKGHEREIEILGEKRSLELELLVRKHELELNTLKNVIESHSISGNIDQKYPPNVIEAN
jgi:hypothetical protein